MNELQPRVQIGHEPWCNMASEYWQAARCTCEPVVMVPVDFAQAKFVLAMGGFTWEEINDGH